MRQRFFTDYIHAGLKSIYCRLLVECGWSADADHIRLCPVDQFFEIWIHFCAGVCCKGIRRFFADVRNYDAFSA
jgi:hypothetical protein